MDFIVCTDKTRLPPLDEEGRVAHRHCRVVRVSLMMPKYTSNDEIDQLLQRLFQRESSIMSWTTDLFKK